MPKKNYIDKKILQEEIVKYKETNIISEELHLMLFEMCNRIGNKPNFVNYTFKEDFIYVAYDRCLYALDKYNTNKKNPYGYFTTVIYNRILYTIFKERQEKEKKENLREILFNEIVDRYPNVDSRLFFEEDEKVNN